MKDSQKNHNLSVSLTAQEQSDLEYLINYFQDQSIGTVTKSDVIKYMIRKFKVLVEKDRFEEIVEGGSNAK